MFTFLKIALRNIIRNKRRSLITISAVGFGLAALIFIWAFVDGAHIQMIENYTSLLTGHIQVHKKGFHEKEQLEINISNPQGIISDIENNPKVLAAALRIKAFGLAASAQSSAGVLILGVLPDKEIKVSSIAKRIKEGRFLESENGNSIVIGRRLAENLNVDIDDKIVLMSQALDGSIASAAFRIKGLLDTGAEEIDKGIAIISYKAAEDLFVMQDRASEIAIRLKSVNDSELVASQIRQALNSPELEVLPWQEISPMLKQWVEFDNGFIWIIVLVVMIVVAIGILNTVLMGVLERRREFGILLALGTQRRQIIMTVAWESLFLGVFGAIIGLILGYFFSLYFGKTGINLTIFTQALNAFYVDAFVYPNVSLGHTIISASLVLITSIVVSLYPAYHAANLKPVDAIRSI